MVNSPRGSATSEEAAAMVGDLLKLQEVNIRVCRRV